MGVDSLVCVCFAWLLTQPHALDVADGRSKGPYEVILHLTNRESRPVAVFCVSLDNDAGVNDSPSQRTLLWLSTGRLLRVHPVIFLRGRTEKPTARTKHSLH